MGTGIITLGPYRYSGQPGPSEAQEVEREKLVREILELRDKALAVVPDWYSFDTLTPEQDEIIKTCVRRMVDRKARVADIDAGRG